MLLRYTTPPLHGPEVARLQGRLISLGVLTGQADGVFGRDTARAVRAFQSRAGLPIDGVAGPETLRQLFSEAPPASSTLPSAPPAPAAAAFAPAPSALESAPRALALSMPLLRGPDVVSLQQQLRALGHLAGKADGIFGPGTGRAVRAFQAQQGLPQDGVVAGETASRLQVAVASLPAAPAAHAASTAPAARAESTAPAAHAASTTSSPRGTGAARIDLGALSRPHCRFEGSVQWQLTPHGVAIDGRPAQGSGAEPRTVRKIWQSYRTEIERAAARYDVPVEVIIANIAAESSGNPNATRREPGYVSDRQTPHRVSYGLMQTLLSTARAAVGINSIDRDFLLDPDGSIRAGTAYIAQQATRTKLDPPVIACAYNAGSVIRNDSPRNRWRMRQYPIGTSAHADRWVAFFNDCFVLLANDRPQAPSFVQMLGTLAPA